MNKRLKYGLLSLVGLGAGVFSIFTTEGDWTMFCLMALFAGGLLFEVIFKPEALEDYE